MLSEERKAAIEAACREWAAANGVPDDDWKSRAGYNAGAVAEAERAEALVEALRMVERLWREFDCDEIYGWVCVTCAQPTTEHADWCAAGVVAAALAPYREAEAPRIGTLDTFFDAVERRRGEAEAG